MMLPRIALLCRGTVLRTAKRNVGITAPCLQTAAVDPIQKLFIDTIHDYSAKSKGAGGKLVDMSPEMEKNLKDELDKLARQYGSVGADFTKFPTFTFKEPELEPVGLQLDPKKLEALQQVEEEEVKKEEDDDKCWFDY